MDLDERPETTLVERARKESNDRRAPEAAVQILPRYTTGKELRETVNRMKVGSDSSGGNKTMKLNGRGSWAV